MTCVENERWLVGKKHWIDGMRKSNGIGNSQKYVLDIDWTGTVNQTGFYAWAH